MTRRGLLQTFFAAPLAQILPLKKFINDDVDWVKLSQQLGYQAGITIDTITRNIIDQGLDRNTFKIRQGPFKVYNIG